MKSCTKKTISIIIKSLNFIAVGEMQSYLWYLNSFDHKYIEESINIIQVKIRACSHSLEQP